MKNARIRNVCLALVSVSAAAAAVVVVTGVGNAQGVSADAVAVGTYDIDQVFEQHPAQAELMQLGNAAQAEMRQAQESGDTASLQQIQQQYANQREQLIQEFHNSIAEVMPVAAENANVDVVAMEVVYTADNVETVDITTEVLSVVSEEIGEPGAAPTLPQGGMPVE